jgi:serine phosphatase RsbU (regulator of sigma subunit)
VIAALFVASALSALAAAIAALWRARRAAAGAAPATPATLGAPSRWGGGGRALALVGLALLTRDPVGLLARGVLDWAAGGGPPTSGPAWIGGIVTWILHAGSTALLLWTIPVWLARTAGEAVAPRGLAARLRSPEGLLAISLAIEALQTTRASLGLVAALALLVALYLLVPRDWADGVRGVRRVALLVGAVAALRLTQSATLVVGDGVALHTHTVLARAQPLPISGPGIYPQLLGWIVSPWAFVSRTLLNVAFAAALATVLRIVSRPRLFKTIGLRQLSLRHRFTMTYVLIRLVPSAITIAILAAGAYLALGVHKTWRVAAAMEQTLERADAAALAALAGTVPAAEGPAAAVDGAPSLLDDATRRLLGADSASARVTVRRVASADPSGAPGAAGPRARGLVVADSTLFLRATRARAAPPDSIDVAESLVPVDSAYVARLARAIGVTIRIAVRPGTGITRTDSTLLVGPPDSAAERTTPAVAVWAPDPGEPPDATASSAGFLDRRRYLARDFLSLGNWTGGIRQTGVSVRLETTVRGLARRSLRAAAIPALVTIGTPAILIAVLALGLAEMVAVRAGRGIARAVLLDVHALSGAARHIGRGDLDIKVPVRGNDELGRLATAFNEMTDNLKRHQAELLEKERLEADLAVAREIQLRLLPQQPPRLPGLDVAGVSIPSREVGGDLFAFLPLDGGRLGVALGDVSGKSVPAALLMSNALAALKAQVQHAAPVDESLANVNRLICADVEPGRFVTLFYAVVDPAAGEMRHASAGHNPPLHVDARGEVRWLVEGGPPLGVQAEAAFPAATAPLSPGDVLVIYSDGVTEAEGPPEAAGAPGEPAMFGDERLAEAVRALRGATAADLVDGIVSAVRAFASGVAQADDLTLVVIKIDSDPIR